MHLTIADTFNRELPKDLNTTKTRRQVYDACFSEVRPRQPTEPKLIHTSLEMLLSIGLKEGDQSTSEFLNVFSGKSILKNSAPYAMCYGGHQFGQWAGQLGDGRAINLAEVVHNDQRWALQLKGAGETPYSRSADGLAVLRSSIREHLCSEAMHHLGVPTTRSLSLILTGDQVLRDIMYDGNAAYEKGAIVCRVAPSFIRFGNFQIFTARGDFKNLKNLADYTIRHFFPTAKEGTKEGYLNFFRQVTDLTLDMILHWQRVGFVHGVMNTDNMSILGLTIDYGPYGWLEGYDPDWTPNTTDAQGRRYRFGSQPPIAFWNLIQLANALVPLIKETGELENILESFRDNYAVKYIDMMSRKLGWQERLPNDENLIKSLVELLKLTETDMTIFFRNLSKIKDEILEGQIPTTLQEAFYQPQELNNTIRSKWLAWLRAYTARAKKESQNPKTRQQLMNQTNPKYVLRNYMAQLAIDQADKGDYALIDELYQLLKKPYHEQPEQQKWFAKRPEWARHKVGCSMLSCSS